MKIGSFNLRREKLSFSSLICVSEHRDDEIPLRYLAQSPPHSKSCPSQNLTAEKKKTEKTINLETETTALRLKAHSCPFVRGKGHPLPHVVAGCPRGARSPLDKLCVAQRSPWTTQHACWRNLAQRCCGYLASHLMHFIKHLF